MAANETQRETVEEYITKAAANGVEDLYWIDRKELAVLEPEVVGGWRCFAINRDRRLPWIHAEFARGHRIEWWHAGAWMPCSSY